MSIKEKIIREGLLEYKCTCCGNTGEWYGKTISLQLHHKDGNHQNNELNNLEFLCPNCHAATDSYCKNKQNSVDENKVIELIEKGYTIRQVLLSFNMSDGSANYTRIYEILARNGIDYVNFSHNQHKLVMPTIKHFCVECGVEISSNSTRCKSCENQHRRETGEHANRIVERPSKEKLLEEIATSSFLQVGKKYGVTDNAIRKWCKAYGLPTHKKEIKELYEALIS